jgi:hypothetical protein
MSLGEGIFEYLSSELSVGERVYPLTLPARAGLPAVVFQTIPAAGPLTTHGDQRGAGDPVPTNTGYQRSRVQFGCWASTYEDAEALAIELFALLHGFTGPMGPVTIHSALGDLSQDDYDEDRRLYRRVADFMVSWSGPIGGS